MGFAIFARSVLSEVAPLRELLRGARVRQEPRDVLVRLKPLELVAIRHRPAEVVLVELVPRCRRMILLRM